MNDLKTYVQQEMQRNEILDFVSRDYSSYAWSMQTLDKRFRFFNIYYTDVGVSLQEAKNAISNALAGPGSLLGYRTVHLMIRQKYELNIPRDVVYDLLTKVDPD